MPANKKKPQPQLGEDPRERVDAIRRLQENTQEKKNQLDLINEEMDRKRGGLSRRNREVFGEY